MRHSVMIPAAAAAAAAALGTKARTRTGAGRGAQEVSQCRPVTRESFHRYLSSRAMNASQLCAVQYLLDGSSSLLLFEPLSHGVISRNHDLGPR